MSKDSTQQKIVNAAEQLFAENSYQATTLRQIAEAVGIKEPSIYAHFANKEAIYEAVIDRALQPFYSEINDWNQLQLSLKTLQDIPRRMLELHARHPYSAQILHREYSLPADKINHKVMQWLEQIAEQSHYLIANLRDGDCSKEKSVAHIIATTNLTLGVFSSLGIQSLLLADAYDPDKMFEEHVKIATRMFKSVLL
ncbi:MAG: TetR/AcrR family transcriptional regulator [Pseudomonadales bacterium]|nr:TetR/AcrR family transcriptional regulator [Pseudomonadales bacterium]